MAVWPGADPEVLARHRVPARTVEEVIGDEGLAAVETAGRTWARLWGRLPLVDGSSFRELATWRDASLLWLTEGFVGRETSGPRCARLVELSLQLLKATGAPEVDAVGLPATDAVLLARACTATGVLYHGAPPRARPLTGGPSRGRAPGALEGILAARQAPPLPPARLTADGPWLLVVTEGTSDGGELSPLLEAAHRDLSATIVVVSTDNLGRWRTRPVVQRARKAASQLRDLWKRIHAAPGVRESYRHRGVGFSDLAAEDLRRILLAHLPGAVVQLESAIELFGLLPRPAAIVVHVPGRDERRTLLAAATVAGLPAAVVRSGPVAAEEQDRQDRGPRAHATLAVRPGSDTAWAVARLAEVARASVEPE